MTRTLSVTTNRAGVPPTRTGRTRTRHASDVPKPVSLLRLDEHRFNPQIKSSVETPETLDILRMFTVRVSRRST